ncbi:MAG: glycoside hydrolase [Phyllobacterium sp.]|uniref:glycoside hydrolase n=1 Tax=Phyllobacterium sp. TaxID=1871046 RepID=UPI0030F2D911
MTTAVGTTVLLAAIILLLPGHFLGAAITERSNHTQPARQLGGLAIVPIVLASLWIFGPAAGLDGRFMTSSTLAALLLWITGFFDDRHHLPESVRLVAQLLAAGIAVYGLGSEFRLLPELLPLAVERFLLALALVYFINLTNFMDGLDLMVVSGLGIPLALVATFAAFGLVTSGTGMAGACIAGGLFGFAFFNRPKARVFLGDSGSLPIGLLSGLVFFLVARDLSISAGLLLPLFFIADATSTLIMRLAARENILAAHSKHAYQIAKRSGWSVWQIVACVGALNLILGICAIMTSHGGLVRIAAILAGLIAATLLLSRFRVRKPPAIG